MDELEVKISTLLTSLERLRGQLPAQVQTPFIQIVEHARNIKSGISYTKQRNEQFDVSNRKLSSDYKELRKKHDEVCSEYGQNKVLWENERQRLCSQVEVLSSSMSDNAMKMDTVEAESQRMKTRINRDAETQALMREQLDQCFNNLSEYETRLVNMNMKLVQEEENHQQETEKLEKMVRDLRKQVQDLEDSIYDPEAYYCMERDRCLRESSRLDDEVQSLSAAAHRSSWIIKDKDNQLKTLETKMIECERKLRVASDNQQSIEQKLQSSTQQVESLAKERDSLNKHIDDLNCQLNDIVSQIASSSVSLVTSSDGTSSSTQQTNHEENQDSAHQLVEDNQTVSKEQQAGPSTENGTVLQSIEMQKKALEQELQDLKSELAELESNNQLVAARNKIEVDHLKEQMDQLVSDQAILQSEYQSIQKQLTRVSEEKRELLNQMMELQVQLGEKEKESSSTTTNTNEIPVVQSATEALKESMEIAKYQTEVNKLTSELSETQEELTEMKEIMDSLNDDLESIRKELAAQRSQNKITQAQQKTTVELYETQLEAKQALLKDTEQKLENAEKQIKILEGTAEHLELKQKELRAEVNERQNRIKELESAEVELKVQVEKFNQIHSSITSDENSTMELEIELEQQHRLNQTRLQEINSLRKENEVLQNRVQSLIQRVKDFESKFQSTTSSTQGSSSPTVVAGNSSSPSSSYTEDSTVQSELIRTREQLKELEDLLSNTKASSAERTQQLETQLEMKEAALRELHDQVRILTQQAHEYKEQLNSVGIGTLTQQNQDDTQLNTLSSENVTLKQMISEKQEEIVKLTNITEETIKQSRSLQDQLSEQRAQIEQYKQHITGVREGLSLNPEQNPQNEMHNLTEAQVQLDKQREHIQQLEQEVNERTRREAELVEKLEEVTMEAAKQACDFVVTKECASSTIHSLEQQLSFLRSVLDEKNIELKAAKTSLQEKEQKVAEWMIRYEQTKKEQEYLIASMRSQNLTKCSEILDRSIEIQNQVMSVLKQGSGEMSERIEMEGKSLSEHAFALSKLKDRIASIRLQKGKLPIRIVKPSV